MFVIHNLPMPQEETSAPYFTSKGILYLSVFTGAQLVMAIGVVVLEIAFKLMGFGSDFQIAHNIANCFEDQRNMPLTPIRVNIILSISLVVAAGCVALTSTIQIFILRYFCLACKLSE
jgi:hypothetical protein